MDDFEHGDFAKFFGDRLKERGLTLKRLSELTGIAMKHLEALASGNFKNLPSAPYFHGYLERIGKILEFDPEIWWARFKGGGFVKDAGAADAPPRNRFLRPGLLKFGWIVVLAVVAVVYLALEFPRIFGMPTITIINPAGNPARVATNNITISGTLKNGSNLYVGTDAVEVKPDGSWEKQVLLSSGTPNNFEIRAEKFLGGETKITEQIIYEPATASSTTR